MGSESRHSGKFQLEPYFTKEIVTQRSAHSVCSCGSFYVFCQCVLVEYATMCFLVPMMPLTTCNIFHSSSLLLSETGLIPLQPQPPPRCRITRRCTPSLLMSATVPLEQHQNIVPLSNAVASLCSYGFLWFCRSGTQRWRLCL